MPHLDHSSEFVDLLRRVVEHRRLPRKLGQALEFLRDLVNPEPDPGRPTRKLALLLRALQPPRGKLRAGSGSRQGESGGRAA